MYVDICIYDYRVLEVQSKVKPALKSFLKLKICTNLSTYQQVCIYVYVYMFN